MARTRATDYDDKRRAILDRSAALFAAHGYDRATMRGVAAACGVSKATLYHYYEDKADLLFDVIRCHLQHLLDVASAADRPDLPPRERLRALVGALLDAYRDADAQHKVQINNLALLPDERQAELRAIERALVAPFADAIGSLRPDLRDGPLLKPLTMSLFGMLNWHYLWFRPDGAVSRADYAHLVTGLVADGGWDLAIPDRAAAGRACARAQG